jgi:hypothetical protein
MTRARLNPIYATVRNATVNQEPITQGESTKSGMSSTIYTGNGTGQSVTTGVDMATGDFGGLVWIKGRNYIVDSRIHDSVRGNTKQIYTSLTNAETTTATALTSFDSTGFSIGADAGTNQNTNTYVAWSFQTNKKVTGLTNRNKAYTAHYNTDLGFSIVGYVGDGVDGHEIPHHLGKVPELSIFKNRDTTDSWVVTGSIFNSDNYLILQTASALATSVNINRQTLDIIQIQSMASMNASAQNLISYHFASIEGVSKVGKYIGTGAAGNYVDCGFKPAFVFVKNLTTAQNWFIHDGMRGDNYLLPNSSGAEGVATSFDFVAGGFVCTSAGSGTNELNSEFIFLAFAETNIDATKAWTDYTYPTTADTISVENNTVVSVANGFNSSGQVDTQYEFTGGVTKTYGVGHEDKHYYLYTSKTGVLGESEYRPLIGWDNRNDADKWGVQSPLDASLRTTAKHFDYESETGVVLASGEAAGGESWKAFSKLISVFWYYNNTGTYPVTLQYKLNEKRVLKGWRIREKDAISQTPKRFTIEGSNDGLNWTAIDSTYTASDYVGNGAFLWGDLQDTSANSTAYLYHRVNITANNGDVTFIAIAELEFNTILPADYYLAQNGKMYDSTGTPIERTYLAEFKTDSDGNVINETLINYPVAKQDFGTVEVHEDLKVHGEIFSDQVFDAWVAFDFFVNPPLILKSKNVADVVDLGTGLPKIIFENPMNSPIYGMFGSSSDDTSVNISSTSGMTVNSCKFTIKIASTGAVVDRSYVFVGFIDSKEIK